jgi:phasin family protein
VTSQKPPYDFGDLSKLMSEFKFPEIDWQGLMAAQQKNLAALGQANQVWFEGAQTVVQREVEIMQKAMAEAAEASKELMQQGDARAGAEKRLELAKRSFETAIRNMRELSELAARSNQEALDVIHRRAMAGFDEIGALVKAKR